ncbi:MAG TPA: TIGR00730 family Rossman fold protein [Bacteroidales bacterium]|jgi:hypothetical protein|nr:TIGR00730 family Rossman fold protein [Bacteroidales bacterium]HOS71029.1 TIGR00730 family Rossman fold protein [Bacteroidales bacterium]HQH25621.1 TIGR00730 family Rossman fold protein [Bacteroidales bacterium]HQJ82826.1 TIGR00730 family Rossman fold protein [Bacteroidales bacterium]
MMTVCVFAASSSKFENEYGKDASRLGSLLAKAGISVVYGGGGIGLMNALASAVISNNGNITGVIPAFMQAEGWGNDGENRTIVTSDMNERKRKMFGLSDAIVALPGGMGTLEELTEAITLKQLGLFNGPVIILNTCGFYDYFLKFTDNMVENNFLRKEHKGMWEVVNSPEEVMEALSRKAGKNRTWRSIARI